MLNHIVLMGRLTRDPELRRTGSGVAVASFSLAVDRDYGSRENGEKVVGLLRKVRERFGTTIVLVTHDESVAAAADRVVRISDGRVVDGKE